MPGLFFAHTVHQTAEPAASPLNGETVKLAATQTAKDTLRAQSAALILEVGPSQPENADVAERDRLSAKCQTAISSSAMSSWAMAQCRWPINQELIDLFGGQGSVLVPYI